MKDNPSKLFMRHTLSWYGIPMAILFVIHLFFTFYNLEQWAHFDWDQVDNAWASLRIILAHKYPLIGMVAKQNSGMYIGPLYYYGIALLYAITGLDPIASPIAAGLTRIFDFFVLWYVSSRLFGKKTAAVTLVLYVFSAYAIRAERSQWPVNFVASLSLLSFLYLYEIIKGNSKFFIHLGVVIGAFFNIHFTALFIPIIGLCTLPIIPKRSFILKPIAIGLGIILIFLLPTIAYYSMESSGLSSYSSYAASYYHGFHLRRFLQITFDAFIKFQTIFEIPFPWLKRWSILVLPAFVLTILFNESKDKARRLLYLSACWFLIPWILFSTYAGEISDYYFNSTMYLVYVMAGYISVIAWNSKRILLRGAVFGIITYYVIANSIVFSKTDSGGLTKNRIEVMDNVENGHAIGFTQGDPKSYLYFYYIYKRTYQQPYKL